MEKFTPLAKNFTLPPALTALTNSTSDHDNDDVGDDDDDNHDDCLQDPE